MLLLLNNLRPYRAKTLFTLACLPFFCLSLFSCVQTLSDQSNSKFVNQYGGDVRNINSRRDEQKVIEQKMADESSRSWKTTKEIFDIDNVDFFKSALVDTSQITLPKPSEEFTPNIDTYYRGKSLGLPDDMFMVRYNPDNFPDSYGRPRLSFDDIKIPGRDYFGVSTDLGDKDYQLVGRRELQRDIDFSRSLRERDDNEISLELIRQEKEKKRKEYLEQRRKDKKEEQTEDQKDGQKDGQKDDKKVITEEKKELKIESKKESRNDIKDLNDIEDQGDDTIQ